MTADHQRANVRVAAGALARVATDHELVISHGNGPQVGLLALQGAAYQDVDAYPLDVLGAETQGMIGYLVEQEVGNLLPMERPLATLLTMVEVDPDDPAFRDPTKFVEREVRLGRALGDRVEVVSGLAAGDSVVSKGSFFVRAEAERLGLRSPQSAPAASPVTGAQAGTASLQAAKILVTERGFEPDRVSLRAGSPARLTFVRTTDKTCGTEVVFPSLNIKRALPLNEAVAIDFTPAKIGDVAFACGMNMLKGVVVVQ